MKNKKFLTGLFVLLVMLCLGIGYATVTKDFTVSGGVTTLGADKDPDNPGAENTNPDELLDQNFLVKFVRNYDAYTISNANGKTFDPTKTTCTVGFTDDCNATIDVKGLAERGDTVVVTFTVVNESVDLDAIISATVLTAENGTDEFSSEYFDVEVTNPAGTLNKKGGAKTETTFTVTIKVVKSAIVTQSVAFKVKFNAQAKISE